MCVLQPLREAAILLGMPGLGGRRILITRAAHQAAESAAYVQRAGGVPVCVPCIEVHWQPEAVRAALARAPAHATVLITSANAAEALARAKLSREELARFSFTAVGARTQAALAALDISARAPEGAHAQEAVWAMWQREGMPRHVVFLRAQEGRDWILAQLRAAGVSVELVPAYAVRPRTAARSELQAAFARGVDAATFASRRTAEAFVAVAGEAQARAWLASIPVVAISARAATPLAMLGLEVLVAPEPASFERMIDELQLLWEGGI